MPARPVVAALALSLALPTWAEGAREPWPHFFPFLGAAAVAEGADLPLPLGLSVIFNGQRDTVELSRLRAGVAGREMVPVDFVDWGPIRNHSRTVTARADLWLFPMIDVYAVGGPIWSTTDVALGYPFPSQGPVDSKGWTVGTGLTGALGNRWGFVSADANYNFTFLDILDRPQQTLLVSPRIGGRYAPTSGISLTAWIGGTYLSMRSRSVGRVKLGKAVAGATQLQELPKCGLQNGGPDKTQAQCDHLNALITQLAPYLLQPGGLGSAEIRYDLQVQPQEAWTMLLGAQVELGKRWFALVEANLLGSRVGVTMSAGGRLGI